MPENMTDPQAIKDRLSQIADAVADEATSLDDALSLYEEAIKLGLSACDLSEEVFASDEVDEAVEDAIADVTSGEVTGGPEAAPSAPDGQSINGHAVEEQAADDLAASELVTDDPFYDPDRQ